MRIRRLNNDTNTTMTATVIRRQKGSSPTTETINYSAGVPECESRFMSDVVTTRFRGRSNRGEIIINPMVSVVSKVTSSGKWDYVLQTETRVDAYSPWTWFSDATVSTSGFTGRYRMPMTPLATSYGSPSQSVAFAPFLMGNLTTVTSTLLTKAIAKATASDASALVTYAELDKTFDMFLNGAQSAASLVSRLERTRIADIKEFVRWSYWDIKKLVKNPKSFKLKKGMKAVTGSFYELASMWLGYRYGIMATYYDVQSWIAADSAIGKSRRSRHVVGTTDSYDSGHTVTLESTGNFGKNYYDKRYTRFTRSSAGVLTNIIPEADSAYTFGMERIFSSAWELVPFSFVLDWFVDAGDRIAALEGQWIRPVLGSWVTHRSTLLSFQHRYTVGHTTISGNERLSPVSMDHWAQCLDNTTVVERIANPTLSALPEFRVNLNWKKVIDAVALARPLSSKLRNLLEP